MPTPREFAVDGEATQTKAPFQVLCTTPAKLVVVTRESAPFSGQSHRDELMSFCALQARPTWSIHRCDHPPTGAHAAPRGAWAPSIPKENFHG